MMGTKVTENVLDYPKGYEPTYINPADYCEYRYIIGRDGNDPLVAICMNPSAANDDHSDRTANRVISMSKRLNKDGWFIVNLYPERATDAHEMKLYDEDICLKNIHEVEEFLVQKNITEVWGVWGDDQGIKSLKEGREIMINMLNKHKIKVFYFGTKTKAGNPRHPLQRFEKWDIGLKQYL